MSTRYTSPSPQREPPRPTRTHNSPTPPPLPWLQWEVGERVVVRYREEDGLHDALGEVVEVSPNHVTLLTRRGQVRVGAETMVTGKRVPPRRW